MTPFLFARTTVTCIAAFSILACQPAHVELHAPKANAPGRERVEAYERMHARSSKETHVTYLGKGGAPVGAARLVDYLQLADGQRVYHPEDLMPVLSPQSPAFSAADRSRKHMSTARTINGIGWGAFGIGTTVMLVGIATTDYSGDSTSSVMTPIIIGGGIMLAGVVTTLISGGFARKAMDEKATAFEMYNEGLAMRLHVCSDDKILVPCADRGSTTAAPPPQDEPKPAPVALDAPVEEKIPKGVAGFTFSMSPADAKAYCEETGHTWESSWNGGNCSGTPQSVGLPGRVQLLSCGVAFCELQVVAETQGRNPFDETMEFKRVLQETYGPPATSQIVLPEECKSTPTDCLAAGTAHMNFSWSFSNETHIELSLGETSPSAESETAVDQIRLLYRRPASAATPRRAL